MSLWTPGGEHEVPRESQPEPGAAAPGEPGEAPDLSGIELPDGRSIEVESRAKTTAPTGVEMEALTAAAVALLALYDMAKALDRGMTITEVRLVEKRGGRSGHYRREEGE